MKRLSFPKSKRLLGNSQFKAVLARRMSARDGVLTVCMAENDCDYPRLGVSVGRSCGNAVVRNRLKRLVREAFRQSRGRIPGGFDYVVMISPRLSKRMRESAGEAASTGPTFEQVKASFLSLISVAVERASRRSQKGVEAAKNCPENGAQRA